MLAAAAHGEADRAADHEQQRRGRGGERRAQREAAQPAQPRLAPARRHGGLRLALDDLHEARLERGRRRLEGHGQRQGVGRDTQAVDLLAARRAHLEVRTEAPGLVLVQRAEHPGAGGVAQQVVVGAHGAASASWSRILASPSRILPLTVPMGASSIAAISEWLKPPK